jgi:hypothetical protein
MQQANFEFSFRSASIPSQFHINYRKKLALKIKKALEANDD